MSSRPLVHPFPDVIAPLTSVRIFLALGVVFFHYQLQWSLTVDGHSGLLNRARLGVDAFFILSGFILAHVYLRGGQMPNYRDFLVSRLARIYPAHAAIMLGLGAVVLFGPFVGVELSRSTYNLPDFMALMLMVSSWFPRDHIVAWNGPAWSLSAEWFAYLSFPVFAWVALKLRDRGWILLGLAVALFVALDASYRATAGMVLPRAEDSMGILRIIPEFLGGMALYWLGLRWNPGRRSAALLALATAALFFGLMQVGVDDRLIVAAAGPFLLSLALLAKAGVRSWLDHPRLMFWGEASFALYLVHEPVLMAWRTVIQKLLGQPDDYLMGPLEIVVLLVISLAAAAIVHRLIELPGRRLMRCWLGRREAPPNGPDLQNQTLSPTTAST